MKKIIIGNDHGGYDAKQEIVKYLEEKGIEVTNVGSDESEIVRYPHFVQKVTKGVLSKEFDGGILICSTGIGMSIAANKFKGIRASVCTSHYMGKMTRQHNNSNILCLGGKITGIFELLEIVDAWISNDYIGGRHDISLGIIEEEIENKNFK